MRHTKALVVIAGVLASALGGGIAHAGDVYKYVDERGITLYTDKPIPGAVLVSTGAQRPAEFIERNNAANQASTNAQLSASNQRIATTQSDARAAANVAKDLEASRAERCKEARETYTKAINSQRLYRQTPDGKREYLSDAELESHRIESAKAVDSICGPQG
jgi:Domain of unknown function (DUF4124)